MLPGIIQQKGRVAWVLGMGHPAQSHRVCKGKLINLQRVYSLARANHWCLQHSRAHCLQLLLLDLCASVDAALELDLNTLSTDDETTSIACGYTACSHSISDTMSAECIAILLQCVQSGEW